MTVSSFLLLAFLVVGGQANPLIVQTNKGKLLGAEFELDFADSPRPDKVYHKAHAFLSIPFAKPPVGNLRFELPEPADSWSGVRNATVMTHKSCLQPQLAPEAVSVEDCLYLNVIRPVKNDSSNPHKKLPVVVWIHGGGFLLGGNNIDEYHVSNLEKFMAVECTSDVLSRLIVVRVEPNRVPRRDFRADSIPRGPHWLPLRQLQRTARQSWTVGPA